MFLPLGGNTKQMVTMMDEEWEVLEKKALGKICFILPLLVAFNISKEKTTKGVMSALVKLYDKP